MSIYIDIMTGVSWYFIVFLLCIFLIISNVELFDVPVGHLYVFGEISIYIFCPLFDRVLVFVIELYELNFGNKALVSCIICKYFLPDLSFHFVSRFLCCANLVSSVSFHLFIFAFVSIALVD